MSDKDKIKEIIYMNAPDYKHAHITGCWGGYRSSGEIFVDFFEDILRTPEKIIITEDGREETVSESNIDRVKHIKVTMSIPVAESIANWLLNKVEQYNLDKQNQTETN